MKTTFFCRMVMIICFYALSLTLPAQEVAQLTNDERQTVVDSVNKLLQENYVFPDIADNMAAHLSNQLDDAAYAGIVEPQAFAQQLTADLQSISNDKHLRVRFAPEQVARMRAAQENPDDGPDEDQMQQARFDNFGFREVKLLDGNIGYLDLHGFYPAEIAGETAVAAMNFLSNSSALIIDLRNNGGGSPSMIQLITSYLYDQEDRIHLNNFYWRPEDQTTQTWTLPYVPGKKMGDTDIYVLTSERTFSAAEEFTYNLKNLERATIVGETTGGGAHPGGTQVATDRFVVWVPSGRAINPITNTNWEGTGVTPHVEVDRDQALTKAHLLALETLAAGAEGPVKNRYKWYLPMLQADLEPVTLSEASLKSCTGTFGPRVITYENGKLMYSRDNAEPRQLIPLTEDLFYMEKVPFFRLEIVRKDGEVVGLRGHYDNGREDYTPVDKV